MDMIPSASPDAPAPDWLGHGPIGRAERRLATLEHVAGIGVRLAEAFAEKAVADANTAWIEPDHHVDPGIPFAGMVRVIRQTLALQVSFEKADRIAAAAHDTRYDPDRRARHTKRRRLIKDAVTKVIKDAADPSDAERLFRDLEEKLHDEEAEERFDDGPVAQVVARICRTLGISVDLSVFEDADTQRGPSDRDTSRRPAGPAAWPQSPDRPPASKPDASKPDAPQRDTSEPPTARPSEAQAPAGPRIPSTFRPAEPTPLEKYLGSRPPPQIPRWPR